MTFRCGLLIKCFKAGPNGSLNPVSLALLRGEGHTDYQDLHGYFLLLLNHSDQKNVK
jgi:hypothetical protein